MSAIDRILVDYDSGTITRRERVLALVRLITPESVEAILASVPQEILQELLDWATAASLEGGVVIGGELSNQAARKVAQEQRDAVLAIREWEKRRERRVGGSAAPTAAAADSDTNGSGHRNQPADEVQT